jgi:DNA-binding response OmpR family regulator
MRTILCVEDELDVLENNRKALEDAGYTVLCAANVTQARDILAKNNPGAIVLDIMLPDGNGLDYLKELRESGNKIPIIMLTAWDKPSDVARGLRLGANDYLSKPFEYDELLARIERMFSNLEQIPQQIMRGPLIMHVRAMEVHFGNNKIKLPPVEFYLLQLLVENEGAVLKAEYLYEHVWGADMNGDPGAIKSTVYRLRKKLEGSGYAISAIYGGGYRFEKIQQIEK